MEERLFTTSPISHHNIITSALTDPSACRRLQSVNKYLCVCISLNFEAMCVHAVEGGGTYRECERLYDEYGSIVQPCLPPQGTICSLSMHHLLVWAVSRATRGGGIRRGYGFDGRGRRWGQERRYTGRGGGGGGGGGGGRGGKWERRCRANVVLCWWRDRTAGVTYVSCKCTTASIWCCFLPQKPLVEHVCERFQNTGVQVNIKTGSSTKERSIITHYQSHIAGGWCYLLMFYIPSLSDFCLHPNCPPTVGPPPPAWVFGARSGHILMGYTSILTDSPLGSHFP